MITKATPLRVVLEIAKECEKCGHCCKFSSGALVDNDIKSIAEFLGIDEKTLIKDYLEEVEKFNTKRLRPKIIRGKLPYGCCIFYDPKQGCKIHPVKPLECKVRNCGPYGEELSIWFMLNYWVNPNDPESIRQFSIYLKTGGKTIPGGTLEELVPNKKRLKKILSYEVLK